MTNLSSPRVDKPQALGLAAVAASAPRLIPIDAGEGGESLSIAFEPGAGAWEPLWQSPRVDLERLLLRPWRDARLDANLPGSVSLPRMEPQSSMPLQTILLNLALAANYLNGVNDNPRGCALDAGPCWLLLPPPGFSNTAHFLRKDGQARAIVLDGHTIYPQDQETQWPPEDLEQASPALSNLCMATAKLLGIDWPDIPLMAQAQRELDARRDRRLVEAASMPGPTVRTRKFTL